jgi:hypothetical protein
MGLKQKFMQNEKLGIFDNLLINLMRKIDQEDCHLQCDECETWYCEAYKNKHKEEYKKLN